MAKFTSKIRNLIFQDGAQVDARGKAKHFPPWAEFVDHAFETADEKVIERLRGLAPEHGVTEVDAPAPAPAPEPSPDPDPNATPPAGQ